MCVSAAGQWKAAQEVFEQMLPCGCKPDGATYGILIGAYDKGNQWCLALQVLSAPYVPLSSRCTDSCACALKWCTWLTTGKPRGRADAA